MPHDFRTLDGMQRVLVVSDNPGHVSTTVAAMRLDGRPVRSERTIEAGLLAAREWRPNVLLLDVGVGITAGGLAAVMRDQQISAGIGIVLIADR